LKEICMNTIVTRAAALALSCFAVVFASGCDSQAAVPARKPAPVVAPAIEQPEPQAPFDETPITPMETVGAGRID
jgi:hypothetical protein